MADELFVKGKIQSFQDNNSKNIYYVQDGTIIGIDPTEHPNITNVEQLGIEVSKDGFKSVKVLRLEDLYIEDIDVYHINDGEEYSGLQGQFLGDDINLSTTKIRVYYASDSGVNFTKEYDLNEDITDGIIKYKVELCESFSKVIDSKKITTESKYAKVTFEYQDLVEERFYEIKAVKKLKSVEYEWINNQIQFTRTKINTNDLRIILNFQNEDPLHEDIKDPYYYSEPPADFSFSLVEDKWGADTNGSVTLNYTYYLSEKEGFYSDESGTIEVEKSLTKKEAQYINYKISSKSNNRKYFKDEITNTLVCTYVEVSYNNGDTYFEKNEEGLSNVTLYSHFTSELDESNNGIKQYYLKDDKSFEEYTGIDSLENGYTKEWYSDKDVVSCLQEIVLSIEDNRDNTPLYSYKECSSYTVYAEFDSLAVDNFKNQYENMEFSLLSSSTEEGSDTIVNLKATYKNGLEEKVPISMNNIEILNGADYEYNFKTKKWIWKSLDPVKKSTSVNLRITYVYNYPDSETINKTLTLIKEKVDSIESVQDSYVFDAGSSVSNALSKIKIKKIFNSTRTELDNPTSIKNDKDIDINNFDVFEDKNDAQKEEINNLEMPITYKLVFSNQTCDQKVILKRNFSKIEPLKSDGTTYMFQEDPHFLSKNVTVDSLSYVKINYSDNSFSKIDLVDDESSAGKLNRLKVDYNITLYVSVWGKRKEQSNYFIFRPGQTSSKYTSDSQLVVFNIAISAIEVSLKNNNAVIYQDFNTIDSLKKDFNYTLTLISDDSEVVTVSYDDLNKYNAKISVLYNNNTISKWPAEYSDTLYNITDNIRFKCSPIEDGYEPCISDQVFFKLYRTVDKIELSENNISYSDLLEINSVKIIGDKITKSDYGYVRVTFTNGYEKVLSDNNEFSKLITYTKVNDITKLVYEWPVAESIGGNNVSTFFISYNESDSQIFYEPHATVKCLDAHSLIKELTITQKKNVTAGSEVETSDLNISLKGLLGEYIEPNYNNLSLSNNKSSSLSTEILVTGIYSYSHPISGSTITISTTVKVSLQEKSCSIDYMYYDSLGRQVNAIREVAAEKSYTPKKVEQKVDLIFSANTFSEIYGYSTLLVYDRDHTAVQLGGFSYDPSIKKLTIPKNIDCNLLVQIHFEGALANDEYGHIYSYIDNKLTGVYDDLAPQSTYRVPNVISVINSGFFNKNKKIKKLIVPSTVEKIEISAFSECSNLQEIIFEGRNSSNKLSIGSKAFYNCSSLTTLDFLSCGDIRQWLTVGVSDNNTIKMDTWTGCKLRTIKINKASFTQILRHYYIDSESGNSNCWLTGRCGGGWKAQIECYLASLSINSSLLTNTQNPIIRNMSNVLNKLNSDISTHESWIKALQSSYSSSNNFSGNTYFHHNTKLISFGSLKVWTSPIFWTYSKGSSYLEKDTDGNIYSIAGSYDFSKKCAATIRSDLKTSIWLVCYGLGYDSFDYTKVVNSGYKFTTNGRVGSEFVSAESGTIGTHFGNWNNTDYVNDCIYPNVRLSNNTLEDSNINSAFNSSSASERAKYNNYMCGTYLDFMIPLYN